MSPEFTEFVRKYVRLRQSQNEFFKLAAQLKRSNSPEVAKLKQEELQRSKAFEKELDEISREYLEKLGAA